MARGSIGPLLIGAGAVLVVVGLLAWSGALSWFGRLPGDIRVERPNARVYVPITAWPTRPFCHRSYHSLSSGCHFAGEVASTSNPLGVPSVCVGNGRPSFQTSSHPSHS